MRRIKVARLAAGVAVTGALLGGCAAGTAATSPSPSPTIRSTSPGTSPSASNTPSVAAQTAPNACRTNAHGQLVKVSLAAQHLWMCHGTRVVHQSAITSGETGQYTETPTGHYRIQDLERDQTLTLIDGQQYRVKYWIPFDAPLFGFHDASWQTFPFGSAKYHHHGSHGCVHMPQRSIATLYRWAHVGTRVDISE